MAKTVMNWSRPPSGVVKLNVDAALAKESAMIAVVARDHGGEIVKAWAKEYQTCDPMLVEATAILWAVQLAYAEQFTSIIIEGDAKVCFDAVNGKAEDCNWSIPFICNDISVLSQSFDGICFCWVNREANSVADSLAKFSVRDLSNFCCNSYSLPAVVWQAWKRDVLASSS